MHTFEDTACRPLKAEEFAKIRRLAYDTFGLDLRSGKETLVSTRLNKKIRELGFRSFEEYYQHVVGDSTGESLIQLIDALTTNHTSFFREIGSGAPDCAGAPSHTTGRAVFRIRRLKSAAMPQDRMASGSHNAAGC
jgi:hypothetical protein